MLRTRLENIRATYRRYPQTFWLLFWGTLVQRSGVSMVWPFIVIFMREQLGVPLTTVTALLTLEAVSGMVSTSVAGMAVDRFGRKTSMILSMIGGAFTLLGMIATHEFALWVIIMILRGALDPLYRVGSQTVIADLVTDEAERVGAFALMRMSANLGVAIGPAVGGFLVVISYVPVFIIAAAAMLLFALLIYATIPETLPDKVEGQPTTYGYGRVLRDRSLMLFCLSYTLAHIPYVLMMIITPAYMQDEFKLSESYFSWMLTLNAAMVVLLQYSTTRYMERYPILLTLTGGVGFFGLAMLLMMVGTNVWWFGAAMVMLTIGEMIVMPTSNMYVANLAPIDMRGRYMSLYTLTWGVGQAAGLSLGGFLTENISPVSVWYAGFVLSVVAAWSFAAMFRRQSHIRLTYSFRRAWTKSEPHP